MSTAPAWHISNAVTAQVVAFVHRRTGDAGVARLLALAGEERPIAQLEDLTAWSSWDQGESLLRAAAEILGGSDVLREVVDEWVRTDAPGEVISLLQSLGSTEAVFAAMPAIAAKFSPMVEMQSVAAEAGHAEITGSTMTGFPRFRELCDYTAGLLAIVPRLFGFDAGQVREEQCELRGDARCVYRVTWSEDTVSAAQEIEFLLSEVQALTNRFNAFKSTARDLVAGLDVETLLTTITARAATAIRAPGYLLVVRTVEEEEPRVHHSGLAPAAVAALVEELLGDSVDEEQPSRILVPVVSGRQRYGWLVALFPTGARFLPEERALLSSYAELAAAALDSATALSMARRENATARALLALARDLAIVTSPRELGARLVRAIPNVVDCDQSTVYLYDAEDEVVRPAALLGIPADVETVLSELSISVTDTPFLREMVARPEPLFIDAATADPFMRGLLEATGAVAVVSVPLLRQGTFYGVISAAVTSGPERLKADVDLLTRLRGVADQAAAALQNAELLEQVRAQAFHDPLTGLPNRLLLEDRVHQALVGGDRHGHGACLLFIDLDRFKTVNDSLGHAAGDELIRLVAARLGAELRASDTLARLGGDEFAILLPDAATLADGEVVADKVLAAMADPFTVSGKDVFVACSIGIAASPHHGRDYSGLLAHADSAMYAAKGSGGRTHASVTSHSQSKRHELLDLESALHKAVERNEFVVLYQPQVHLESSRVVAVEALVRWTHPERGPLPPAEFLPLAEQTGLIVEIDHLVREEALRQASDWAALGFDQLRVALNLSTRELRSPTVADDLVAAMVRHGVSAHQVEVEITDRVDLEEPVLLAVASAFRQHGISVAIDDFGKGSSVLARLHQLPVDTLKIDRSFVQPIRTSADAPLVRALLTLEEALHLTFVAEGIETPEQAEVLRRLGCHLGQGYHFSRPIAPDQITRLLLEQARTTDGAPA